MPATPTVIRTPIGASGAARYTLYADGTATVVKGRSSRPYNFASIYRRDGEVFAWLHARADLADRGSRDAERAGWTRAYPSIAITDAH